MTHAYSELYLNDVMENLGAMFEYAVINCKMNIDQLGQLFVSSGLARHIENGNPAFLAGKSGIELYRYMAEKSNILTKPTNKEISHNPGEEYWTGWILANMQWELSIPFSAIFEKLPCSEIMRLYNPLHEASEEKALQVLIERMSNSNDITRLQRFRKYAELTQLALSEKSGVSLRSIQMYEQRKKDINKAQVNTLISLSKTLGCSVEDLFEW